MNDTPDEYEFGSEDVPEGLDTLLTELEGADIDTYEEFSEAFLDEIYPIRERLYEEGAESIIADFVAENPAGLSESELEAVEGWRDYEFCEFAAVVEHREDDTVFVEPEASRAFAVTAIHDPFERQFPETALPAVLNDLVVLPFEGRLVSDGWLLSEPLGPTMLDFLDMDVETAYGEARHSQGIVETLPPGKESSSRPRPLRAHSPRRWHPLCPRTPSTIPTSTTTIPDPVELPASQDTGRARTIHSRSDRSRPVQDLSGSRDTAKQ
jgi:hypothetical protein